MAHEPKIFIIQFFMKKNANPTVDKPKDGNDMLVIYMQ